MENYLQLLHVSVSSSGYHLSDYHFVSKNPIIPIPAGIKTQSTIKGWDSIISKKQGVVCVCLKCSHTSLFPFLERPHSDVTGLNLSSIDSVYSINKWSRGGGGASILAKFPPKSTLVAGAMISGRKNYCLIQNVSRARFIIFLTLALLITQTYIILMCFFKILLNMEQ